jgi:Amt family ammonium transporter
MPQITLATLDSLQVIDSLNAVADSIYRAALTDSLTVTKVALAKTNASLAATSNSVAESSFRTNNLWMMIASALVFVMHLGFATLESGLTRAKNTTNVLFMNTVVPCISLITFALWGFSLMFPGFETGVSLDYFGFRGFGLHLPPGGETMVYNTGYTFWTDFLFQGMFAATCATIVSGAVAERIKINSFMIFTFFFVSLAYPIIGSWKWGGGWLNTIGFHDFAGSTLVHSVGGWASLAGIILLGPRIGKYENNRIYPIPGHNMTSAVIGTFLLWLGWFGFNGGSILSADPGAVSRVLVVTFLAGCAGGMAAAFSIVLISTKYDLSMVLNGILAGLVGITAGADQMGITDAIIIGCVAGVLVVTAVITFDKVKIDDPVGALSVHLVCGIWGTLAVGILGQKGFIHTQSSAQLLAQLTGIFSAALVAFTFSIAIFGILKVTIGLRVSKEEELLGIDSAEHGMEAYSDFNLK